MKVVKEQNLGYLKKQKRKNCLLILLCAVVGVALLPVFCPLTFPAWAASFWFFRSWRNWRKGIDGEKRVASSLQSLDDSFRALHGLIIDIEYGDIDHLVIGPPGIFAIETKNWTGKVKYDGHWYATRGLLFESLEKVNSPSEQILANSRLLEDELDKYGVSEDVDPIIMFPSPDLHLDLEHAEDYEVTVFQSEGELLEYIENKPATLSEGEVESLCETLLEFHERN